MEISPLYVTVAVEAFIVLMLVCLGLSLALFALKKRFRQFTEKSIQSVVTLKPFKQSFVQAEHKLRNTSDNLDRLKKLYSKLGSENKNIVNKYNELAKRTNASRNENKDEVSNLERQLAELKKDRETHVELIDELNSKINLMGGATNLSDSNPAEAGDESNPNTVIDEHLESLELEDVRVDGESANVDKSNPESIAQDQNQASHQLRTTVDDQRQLITSLKSKLAAANEADTGMDKMDAAQALSDLERLEQKLSESEVCIEILENHLAELERHQNESGLVNDDVSESVSQTPDQPNGNSNELDNVKQELESMNETVAVLMDSNGDQSIVINLAKDSTNCRSHEQLGKVLLEQISYFGISTKLSIRSESGNVELSNAGEIEPEDLEKLSPKGNTKRFKEYGTKLLVQHADMSFLIPDMPMDDKEKCERIRDSLAIMQDLAVASASKIAADIAMKQQQQMLARVIRQQTA